MRLFLLIFLAVTAGCGSNELVDTIIVDTNAELLAFAQTLAGSDAENLDELNSVIKPHKKSLKKLNNRWKRLSGSENSLLLFATISHKDDILQMSENLAVAHRSLGIEDAYTEIWSIIEQTWIFEPDVVRRMAPALFSPGTLTRDAKFFMTWSSDTVSYKGKVFFPMSVSD